MNEIVTTKRQATMPAAPHANLVRALDVALSGAVMIGGETVLLPGKDLRPEHRQMAEARLSILSRSLDARDRQAVTAAIGQMLTGFPSIRQSGDDARALLSAYVGMVDEFPPWAVIEACRRWNLTASQEGHSLAFPPSAAQLLEACQRVINRYKTEEARLKQVLSAKTQPIGSDEKARVSAGFDKMRAELGAAVHSAKKQPMSSAEARVALEKRCAELGVDPAEIDKVKDQPSTFRKIDWLDTIEIIPRTEREQKIAAKARDLCRAESKSPDQFRVFMDPFNWEGKLTMTPGVYAAKDVMHRRAFWTAPRIIKAAIDLLDAS